MSGWTLNQEFFSVRVVDDFFSELVSFMANDEDSTEGEIRKAYDSKGEMSKFCNRVSGQEVEIYQYPDSEDYFERIDDNFVIPAHLFERI